MNGRATTPATPDPIAQPDAQPIAQLVAQPAAELTLEVMPIEPNHADLAVVLRVMQKDELSQDALARTLNISKGHMSRILGGDAPVPFVLVRYLWDRTGDLDLLELLSGPDNKMVLAALRRDRIPMGADIDQVLPTAMLQLAEAAQQSRGGQPRAAADRLQEVICLLNAAFVTACRAAVGQPNIRIVGNVHAVSDIARKASVDKVA